MWVGRVYVLDHPPSKRMPPVALARAEKVVSGERMAIFNYYVVRYKDSEYVHVTDENGSPSRISLSLVEREMVSTSQFEQEKAVTRTQLALKIEGLGHAPFRVTFNKQVSATAVADGLAGEDIGTQTKRRRVVKTLMEGEKRVMHAKLYRSTEDVVEMELGRYRVVDLEASKPGEPAIRMVDTRTVSEVVAEGVRYYVK